MSNSTQYSVVILTAENGVISRHSGTDFSEAKAKAFSRRQDFPDAKEVSVVASGQGALFVC